MPQDLRVGSLNVGTLTGKFLELVDVLRKRSVDVLCIQETRWKGAQSREANGFKLWYSGLANSKNGVGIMLSKELKDNVVEVKRCNDRIMSVRVVVGEKVVNVVCAYAPQVGFSEPEKAAFWVCLDELVESIPVDQFVVMGGDFNGHIGARVDGYHRAHGGFGFGVRNDGGSALLEFATAHELVIVNSVFQKRAEHLITFSSGGHNTQIDYLLMRSRDVRSCVDCKVFPSEACASQHRLLAMDISMGGRVVNRARGPRILWKDLKGEKAAEFKEALLREGGFIQGGDANQMWITMANAIRNVAVKVVEVSSGRFSGVKEAWWWNEEVQRKVKAKQLFFKELLLANAGEERILKAAAYKVARREAKKEVAKAKGEAYEEMYKRLDTKEGANAIFKLAKARERGRRDLGQVRFVKDDLGRVLVNDEAIKDRWNEYFSELFNGHTGSVSVGV